MQQNVGVHQGRPNLGQITPEQIAQNPPAGSEEQSEAVKQI